MPLATRGITRVRPLTGWESGVPAAPPPYYLYFPSLPTPRAPPGGAGTDPQTRHEAWGPHTATTRQQDPTNRSADDDQTEQATTHNPKKHCSTRPEDRGRGGGLGKEARRGKGRNREKAGKEQKRSSRRQEDQGKRKPKEKKRRPHRAEKGAGRAGSQGPKENRDRRGETSRSPSQAEAATEKPHRLPPPLKTAGQH